MIILKFTFSILKYLGLMFNYSSSFYYRIYFIFCVLNVNALIIPKIVFYVVNLRNIVDSTDVLLTLAALICTSLKILLYTYYYDDIIQLVGELESNMNRRIAEGYGAIYIKTEKNYRYFSKFILSVLVTTITIYICLPLGIVCYHWYRGILTAKSWHLPFKFVLFYDYTVSPYYEITYVMCFSAGIFSVSVMAGIDSLFLGLCLHICANFDDLQVMIKELDNGVAAVPKNDYGKYWNVKKVAISHQSVVAEKNEHLERIRRCVGFHNRVYRFVAKIEEIFSIVIFFQYFTSTFMLCSVAFQILSAFSINRVMASVALMAASGLQLFIYSWFGTFITDKASSTSDAIYDCLWYEKSPRERFYYLFMLSRSQMRTSIRALRYFSCSLDSFRKVISMTSSTLALLQNFQKKMDK